jgi:CheY-specific phosphatase CheX
LPDLIEALRNSVTDVLEKMFFVRTLDEDELEACGNDTVLTAQLTFRGQPSGGLRLRIPAKAARSIAADFLGARDEELTDREVGEVICELANMICGSVLSRVESTVLFRLDSPRLIDGNEAANAEFGENVVGISHGAMSVCLSTVASECLPSVEYAS